MSSHSDHERALDQLLRARPAPGGEPSSCVDPERLAAWAAGTLGTEERDAVDAHIASCDRCLAVLAALGDMPVSDEAAPVLPFPAPAARPRPVRWMVPLAATAAAAVLIWMVVPHQPNTPASAPAFEMARNEDTRPVPAPSDSERQAASRDSRADRQNFQATAAAPPRPLAKQAERDEARPREQAPPPTRAASADAVQEKAGAPATVVVPSAPAAEPAAQQAANDVALADRMAAAGPPAAAAPAAPAPARAAASRAEAASVEILSPDRTVRWRVRGRSVERSTDAGATWQAVTMPTNATATGGSSPAASVCWLIGPSGAVFRSVDGVRFESVPIAGAGALSGITASDADRAVVTTTDGRTYRTADGGRTWTIE